MRIVVGITGASGTPYARRFLEVLGEKGIERHVIITANAKKVALYEEDEVKYDRLAERIYSEFDLAAPVASGSFITDGMVIVPCSMKTISSITHGLSENCITRAAEVTMKERRPLILVPREAPFHAIHLENMLKLARLGVTILPAMPAFYTKPRTIDDIVNFVVGRILDCLRIEHTLFPRWGEEGC